MVNVIFVYLPYIYYVQQNGRGYMYKKLLLICLILSAACPAHAYKVKTFKPLVPQMQNMNTLQDPYQNTIASNESYPKITQLEESIFKKNYEKQNIYTRLNRLEKKVFNRTFSGLPLSSRVDNLISNIDTGMLYGITSKDLAKLETKVLGRTYMNDDTESRITRMEKEMLGAMQGGNLKDRFDTIKTASKHYNSYPELIQSQQIYPQSTFGYNPYGYSTSYGPAYGTYSSYRKPGILNRLFGGYSPGMLTGFTPPIYDPYSMYTRPGMGHSRYVRGMRGWHLRNRSTGSGTRVRILD